MIHTVLFKIVHTLAEHMRPLLISLALSYTTFLCSLNAILTFVPSHNSSLCLECSSYSQSPGELQLILQDSAQEIFSDFLRQISSPTPSFLPLLDSSVCLSHSLKFIL